MTGTVPCKEFPKTCQVDEEKGLHYSFEIGHPAREYETAKARYFATGATRDTDEGKLDFDGFLSPLALRRFAEYMHECRKQSDGKLRDSDNWQKGIPQDVYRKSMWRHFFSVWEKSRAGEECIEDLCALMFNVQGLLHCQVLHEQLKETK
jgi:hypothetical protein